MNDKIDPRVGDEKVRCAVCGDVFEQITWTHLGTHDMDFNDYFDYMNENDFMLITKSNRIIQEVADSNKVSENDILNDLKKVSKKVDGHLGGPEYNKHGKFNYMLAINKFGSWAEACEKAGIEGSENIKEETVIQDIRRVAETCEDGFTTKVYNKEGNYSRTYIDNKFDQGFEEAVRRAQVERKEGTVVNPIDRKDIVQDLIEVSEKCEGVLTRDKYVEFGNYSPRLIQRRLGEWNQVKNNLGLKTKVNQYEGFEKEDLLEDLKKVKSRKGKITKNIYEECGDYAVSSVLRHFEDWSDALIKAGILPNRIDDFSQKDVLITIKYASTKIDGNLSIRDYREHSPYSFGMSVINDFFGNWNKAKRKAGLETVDYDEKVFSDEELLEWIRKADNQVCGSVSRNEFDQIEEIEPSSATIILRFGSWTKAKKKAGVDTASGIKEVRSS